MSPSSLGLLLFAQAGAGSFHQAHGRGSASCAWFPLRGSANSRHQTFGESSMEWNLQTLAKSSSDVALTGISGGLGDNTPVPRAPSR